jgi:hypothetical protein
MAGILALVGLVVTAWPAQAHPGVEDPYLTLRQPTVVALGVPSEEQAAMVGVDVTLPPSFALQRVDPTPGWQSTTVDGQLRYTGNTAPGQFALFVFHGVFDKQALIEIPVITRAADGTVRDWNGSPRQLYPAAFVCPGYARGSCPVGGSSGMSGRKLLTWAGRLLVILGAVTVAVLLFRRRGATARRW